jgi:DNA-binding GntR family transcriptional regulator
MKPFDAGQDMAQPGGPSPNVAAASQSLRFSHHQTTADRASHYIRWLIWEGHLRAGDRISQAGIAQQLGVSNTPVREALIALEREGFLHSYPNRGCFVAAWTHRSIEDHFTLLALLRGLSVEFATERAGTPELDGLSDIALAISGASEPQALDAIMKEFVDRVMGLSESTTLASAVRNLVIFIPGSFYAEVGEAKALVRRDAPGVIRLMQARRASEARTAVETMFVEVGKLVAIALERRGLVTAIATA